MKCEKCNKVIEQSGYYCPYCGEKIDRKLIIESYRKNWKLFKLAFCMIGILFCLVILPIDLIGNTIRAEFQIKMGDRYLGELDYEQALACYNKALQLDPKNVSAYEGAVNVMLEIGDEWSAVQLLSQCVEETENYEMEVWLSQLLEEREYLLVDSKEDTISEEQEEQVIKNEFNGKEIMEGDLEIINDKNPGIENEKLKWLFSLKINRTINEDYISNFYIELSKIEELQEKGSEVVFKIVNERSYMYYKMYKDVYRFIDVNGNTVTDTMVWDFSEFGIGDNGWVINNNKFIDLQGNIRLVVPDGYWTQGVFHSGLCRLADSETGERCFMNEQGEIISERYYYASDFQNGIAYVGIKNYDVSEGDSFYTQKNKDGTETKFKVDYTYIKTDGSYLINSPYVVTGECKEGLISIKDSENEKYGYADITGKIVVPCIYEYARNAKNGVLQVYNENYGEILLNTEGNTLYDVELYHKSVDLSDQTYMGMVIIEDKNGDKGVVNLNGDIVVPCEYEQITILNDGKIKGVKRQYNLDYSIAAEFTDYFNTRGEKIEKTENESGDWKMTGNEFADLSSKLIISGNGHYLIDRNGNLLVGSPDFMIYLLTDDIFYYTDGNYLHTYQYVG